MKKCKQCGISTDPKTWGKTGNKRYCPVCHNGLGNAVQQIKVVVEPVKDNYRQTITFYATECDGKENKVGKLTDFYTIVQLITRLLEQYKHIVVVECIKDKS